MPKQVTRNRRYADFWSQRKNQCWAGILIAAFSIIAIVGIIYLIRNGLYSKAMYTG